MTMPSAWTRLKFLFSEMKITWKTSGFKGLHQKYGFKLFLAFLCYYLIRDMTIYVVIPWVVAKKAANKF